MILRRLSDSRFSEVLRFWTNETVAIIGGGPSVRAEDILLLGEAKIRCIVVNDSYLLAPWADLHYAADARWHRWHNAGVERMGLSSSEVRERWENFTGQKCTIQGCDGGVIEDDRIHVLRNRDYPNHGWGLSEDPRSIVTGRNSGFQALNIATLAGSKRVLLLGFDGKPAPDRAHWFGEHPSPTPQSAYELYRQAMTEAERALRKQEVTVINCSLTSAIDNFPKMEVKEAL